MARSFFRSVGISLSVLGLGCGVSASVCGCYIDDCSDTLTCGSVCVADPSKEAAKDDCGVFVSSDLGDDANPGTKAKPVKTFERAIALARTGPMRLYACAESFTEPVMLPSGIEVWGGLDCAHDWSYVGDSRSTVIAPELDTVPLHVKAGEGTSIISDLQLEAADATIPGGSSIAMVALVGSVVDLRRSKLIAGNGAKGAPGERGGEEPAKEGTLGNDGAAACTADSVPGAQPVTTVCGDLTTVGGKGGDGTATSGDKGNDGQPAPDPNPQGLGLGGVGETDAFSCLPGQMGSPGADGAHGLGAQWPGSISPEFGWLGKRGYDGGDGSRGQGGGGGGGSRGGLIYCGIDVGTPKGGASGGSGGGGGCGGRGGKGGGFGGASIGLLSFSGDVSIDATSIVTGNGGDGGAGGLAQIGGVGGAPGVGGAGVNGSHAGCWGGVGGAGGNGGYGGGGLGGPTIGIAHYLGLFPAGHDLAIHTGEPGKGGPGGNDAVEGSAGEPGVRADTLGFPQ